MKCRRNLTGQQKFCLLGLTLVVGMIMSYCYALRQQQHERETFNPKSRAAMRPDPRFSGDR